MEYNDLLSDYPEDGVNDFPKRLEEVLKGHSRKDFALAIGMSEGGLRKYLPPGKSKPSFDKVVAMATLAGVELKWLSTGVGPKHVQLASVNEESVNLVSDVNNTYCSCDKIFDEEFALIDGYHVAIGEIGCNLDELKVRRKLAFRYKWLEWRGLKPEDLKVFFVKSYLEGGTISGGDTVMIHTADVKPADGVFAIDVNESILIRWFSVRVDGTVEVFKDVHGEVAEVISQESFKKIRILGRVVWLGKDFK